MKQSKGKQDGGSNLWQWPFILYLSAILVATLWPFNFRQINNARLNSENGLTLSPPSTVYSARPADKLSNIRQFTIVLDLTSETAKANGYARILSYSLDTSRMNFMLGQWEEGLVLLLKNSSRAKPIHFEVEGVLGRGESQRITIIFDGDKLLLLEDGKLRGQRKTGALDFSNWDKSYPLVIGSEGNGKFPWEGKIRSIAIFDRALTQDNIQSLSGPGKQRLENMDSPLISYDFTGSQIQTIKDHGKGIPADLAFPKHFTPYKRTVLETTNLKNLLADRKDILLNIILFLPLGFFLAGFLNFRGYNPHAAFLLAIGLSFTLSLGIELLQSLLPTRDSDLVDVITNTLGAGIGSAIRIGAKRQETGSRLQVN